MSQKILGVDLGTFAVKVVLLERQFSDFQVIDFIQQPLNLQARLSHPEAVTLALEHIFANHHYTDVDVVSATMPGHIVSSRIIEFPFVNVKKLDQMVGFELENYVPTEIENMMIDYHVLEKTNEFLKILCVYFPVEKIEPYLGALSKAALDPKYFGSDLVDLSGISQVAMLPKEGYYAICDIGHTKTNLCLMEGQELRYARTIGIGGIHFTKAIQRAFNLNYEKAEALKISRGKIFVHEEESDQISRTLIDVSRELTSNIRQTFIGFDSFFGSKTKSAIYCTGGGAKLVGLLDYISFQLRLNVLELDPIAMVNHHLPDPEENAPMMVQALANALRPVYSNRYPRINFRKGNFPYKQDIQLITKELRYAGVFLAVIVFLGIGYYFYADHYYSKRMAALDKKIENSIHADYPDLKLSEPKGKSKKEAGTLDRYVKTVKKQLETIRSQVDTGFGVGQATVLEVMREISEKLPPKKELTFEVSEFSFSDDFIRMKARTNDPRNPNQIVAALQNSNLFSEIEATDPKPKPNGVYDFVVKFNLKKEE